MKSHSQITESLQGTEWLKHGYDRDYNQRYKDDWKKLAREDIESFNTERKVYEK